MSTNSFLCVDCGVDTDSINEYYMVHNKLWKRAKGKRKMLCIGCLERRLGRELKPTDFTDAPINLGWFPQSPRLASRLRGKVQL